MSKHMKAAKPLMRYEELPPHSSETAACGKNLNLKDWGGRMSLFAMMMIFWSVERPGPIPSAPRVPINETWPYKK